MSEIPKKVQEKLPIFLHYLENYRKFSNGSGILDYYKIFELSDQLSVELLNKEIKKKRLQILFHPDFGIQFPDEYKEDFKILVNCFNDMQGVFSDDKVKANYDRKLELEKLEEAKRKVVSEQQKEVKRKGNGEKQEHQDFKNRSHSVEKVTREDEVHFDNAVCQNILKHGFEHTCKAILDMVRIDWEFGFTRDNQVRKTIINLGRNKIYMILSKYDEHKNLKDYNKDAVIYYLSSLVNRDERLRSKMDAYIAACTVTYHKYDLDSSNLSCSQTFRAVRRAVIHKEFDGFARDYDSRKNLEQCVLVKDIQLLTYLYLNNFRGMDPECDYHYLSRIEEQGLIKTADVLAFKFVSFLREQMNLSAGNDRKPR